MHVHVSRADLTIGGIVMDVPVRADDASSAQGDVNQSSKSQVFEDASAEIADIDTRLHALQSFLRMAKSTSTTTTTTTATTAQA